MKVTQLLNKAALLLLLKLMLKRSIVSHCSVTAAETVDEAEVVQRLETAKIALELMLQEQKPFACSRRLHAVNFLDAARRSDTSSTSRIGRLRAFSGERARQMKLHRASADTR